MLCERCKKNQAIGYYKKVVNGNATVRHLCADCMEAVKNQDEQGFSDMETRMLRAIFGMPQISNSEKRCPICGTTYSDIMEDGVVGCANCYDTFRNELSQSITAVHGTHRHTGLMPAKMKEEEEKKSKISSLREELKKAVAEENYEQAAILRDKIKKAEKE